ncbi:MAG: MFS transporter [Chloroflexi bacterium]|nr:MAG: MFS transporter [Chloroflexota bacterium]
MVTSNRVRWRSLPRNLRATIITSFLMDISTEMIVHLMPLFLANVLGAPIVAIGLIEGLAEMVSSLLKGVSGWLSDQLQSRKRLAVIGYGLSALVKPILYFVTTWHGVLVIRSADRVGKGIRTSPRDALIANSVATEQRGIAFGLHRAGDTAGAVVGLVIALAVVLATQSSALTLSRATFQLIVAIAAVPGLLAVLVLATMAHEVQIEHAPPMGLNFHLPDHHIRFFLLVVGLFTLGNSSDSFLILRAQERGMNLVSILAMLITFSLIYTLFSAPLGALSDHIGRRRLIVGGWIFYSILYVGFALVATIWQMWLVYALYGLYFATFEGVSKALIADLSSADNRGTAYGYYNAIVGFMALPASLVAGILWQSVNPAAPFLFGAVLAAIASVLLIWQWPDGENTLPIARES